MDKQEDFKLRLIKAGCGLIPTDKQERYRWYRKNQRKIYEVYEEILDEVVEEIYQNRREKLPDLEEYYKEGDILIYDKNN